MTRIHPGVKSRYREIIADSLTGNSAGKVLFYLTTNKIQHKKKVTRGNPDCSLWQPTPPVGDGWIMAWINPWVRVIEFKQIQEG